MFSFFAICVSFKFLLYRFMSCWSVNFCFCVIFCFSLFWVVWCVRLLLWFILFCGMLLLPLVFVFY